ncbi:uncharacterized protein LOC109598690 isoform X2 [Aethina tumida]|uniref:uncharacterized protein LOC109598690 isoform X2 n=1 Tax=Aethina tumida TaxID=116153 RepID=UPI00096AFFC8|nr:uncharacterized protein LOC109598690 isoform X2 [Aethina tumida]
MAVWFLSKDIIIATLFVVFVSSCQGAPRTQNRALETKWYTSPCEQPLTKARHGRSPKTIELNDAITNIKKIKQTFYKALQTKGEFDKPLWLLKNIKKDRKCATNKKLSTKEQLKCQFRVLQKFGIWIDKIEEQKVINVEPAVLDQRLSNYTKAKESLRKVMCEVHEELNKDTRTPKVKNYKFPNEVDRTTMKTLDFKFFKELVNTLTKIQRMSSQRWRKKRDKLKNKN